jgi:hypothetical protein
LDLVTHLGIETHIYPNFRRRRFILIQADQPLPTQRTLSIGRQSRPGTLEKEVALMVWAIQAKIAPNAFGYDSFETVQETWDVKTRNSESLKNLVFPMYEVAIRDAAEKIIAAGAYSITVDYWTAVNGQKFLSITYHWMDQDWNVQSRTLDLVPILKASATGALTQQLIDIRTEDHFRKRPRWSEQLQPPSSSL